MNFQSKFTPRLLAELLSQMIFRKGPQRSIHSLIIIVKNERTLRFVLKLNLKNVEVHKTCISHVSAGQLQKIQAHIKTIAITTRNLSLLLLLLLSL